MGAIGPVAQKQIFPVLKRCRSGAELAGEHTHRRVACGQGWPLQVVPSGAAVGEDSLFVWGTGAPGQLGTDTPPTGSPRRASPGCPRPCGRSRLGTSTRAS